MKKLLMLLFFISCKQIEEKETFVHQTIQRTCPTDPDCYYALYTTVYFKGAEVKKWVDDAEHIKPEQVKGRKAEGDSLIKIFTKLGL